MSEIKLQTSDGNIFSVNHEIALCLPTVQKKLVDWGSWEIENAYVELPNVNSAILKMVLSWVEYHKGELSPVPICDNKAKSIGIISRWDADFLKVDPGTLFELILAADYLDIKGLLDFTSKTVFNMLKGKTVEEIRTSCNIRNDFSHAEEAYIQKQNKWYWQNSLKNINQ